MLYQSPGVTLTSKVQGQIMNKLPLEAYMQVDGAGNPRQPITANMQHTVLRYSEFVTRTSVGITCGR